MCTSNKISTIVVGRNRAFHFKPVYWDIDFRWLWFRASLLPSMLSLFLHVCQECTYWMDCWFNEKCICIDLGTRKAQLHSHNIFGITFLSMLISLISRNEWFSIYSNNYIRLSLLLTKYIFQSFLRIVYNSTFAVMINTQPIVFLYHK